MKVSEMALRHLQRTLRMYSSACSTKRQFTGMRAEFAAIRCGVYTCQTRTMFSEWMYSRKNVDIVAPVYLKAYNYPESVAIVDHQGEHTYGNILYKSHLLSTKLLETADFRLSSDRMPARVCLLCPNNVSYVIAQWATWMSGGMVVPLCSTHPPSELRYFVEDSDCVAIVATEDLAEKIEATASECNKVLLVLKQDEYSIEVRSGKHEDAKDENSIPPIDTRQEQWKTMLLSNKYKRMPAMIIYTSGTTGRPKGVVHTHGSLAAQMDGMTQAWEWKSTDVILHTLPLHHIHGIVNVLMTPLYNGAKCIMLPKFSAEQVWDKLLNEVNLFMAVPTVYAKLIEYYEENYGSNDGNSNRILNYRSYIKHNLTVKVRLMVSGSAALPEPIMTKWEEITGYRLLERYGMTEIGMALTNPLRGPRIAGSVGQPFPGVEVAIGKPNAYIKAEYDIIAKGNQYSSTVTPGLENESGELLVRGPNVFVKYWQRPEATEKTFTSDGWFKTGDTARYSEGNYKILGRTSVDIIKSGGYKISALDIERHLLTHDDITEVAVIGLPDHMFGQRIAAVLVLKEGSSLKEDDLKTWCKDKMPKYQIPSVWEFLGNIPRNAMGKVNKKELAKQVFPKQLRGFL